MSEIPVPEGRYAFLGPEERKRCCCLLPDRYVILSLILSSLTFIVGTIYVTTVGVHQRVIFPKTSGVPQVPQQWIERAIAYNSLGGKVIQETKRILRENPVNYDYKLVCYYNFPSANVTDVKHILLAESIDPHLCTHINVGFASVLNNSIRLSQYELNVSRAVIKLKDVNPKLKVLVSVGGAENAQGYPEMVVNHQNRKLFIQSILEYVKVYRFDGVDLDWEFPSEHPGSDKRQKTHFTQLLVEIRKEINRQEKHKFLLSVAVAAPAFLAEQSYDISYMNEYVDYVNLMSYDYHFYTQYTPFTGFNAPLYHRWNDELYLATLNINYSANYWVSKGMDRKKIIIGLPTYGHSFKLVNALNHGLMAPARGYGTLGNNGFVDYAQVCWFLRENQINPVFDIEAKSPYATKKYEWISFDNQESLMYKAEYVKYNHYGGAMVLSLNTDDHRGACEAKTPPSTFPLTRTIKEVLRVDLF